jgi:hypothetical protein
MRSELESHRHRAIVCDTTSSGVGVLRLETGIHQRAAIALYERAGFRRIAPFSE